MAGRNVKPSLLFPARQDGERAGSLGIPSWAIVGIFLILALRLVAEARSFLMPVVLGLLLFFVFSPVRRAMIRMGIGSRLAAGLIALSLLLGLAGLGFVVSGPVSSIVQNASSISTRMETKMRDIRSRVKPLEEAAAKIDEISSGIDAAAGGAAAIVQQKGKASSPGTAPSATGQPGTTTATVSASTARPDVTVRVDADSGGGSVTDALMALGPEIASQVGFTLLFLFFLLDAGDLLYLKIVQSFDRMRDKRGAYMALREIESSLGTYLGAITLINTILAVLFGLAMWAWGMPSPILFAIGMFVANFVPYIGPFVVLVMSGVVAMFVYDDFWRPVLIAGTAMALTSIEGQFITPYFVSRRLQLNTVVVFFTVALWAWLWSVLGMVVAVPVLVVLRVLTDHIPGLQKVSNFLAGDEPPQLDDADEEDARNIVEAGDDETATDAVTAAVARVPPSAGTQADTGAVAGMRLTAEEQGG